MNEQILVIEDDRPIRESLKELLESEGYRVSLAENGQMGLKALADQPAPSVILLDLSMPVMDGRAFIARLKADFPELRSLPVIIMSAAGKNELSSFPFEWVIRKPLEVDDLLSKVERLARKSP